MKLIINICILFCLFTCIDASLMAQQVKTVKGNVQGLEEIGKTKLSLPNASVAILNFGDSTFVKGTVSRADGNFEIKFSPQKGKKYLLKASFMGFQSDFRILNDTASVVRMGTILLQNDGVLMDEVVVMGKTPDITTSQDTTLINTSAFKAPEGAELRDLIRRIPGLDYDEKNNTLTYDGKPIHEITVNGQSFFRDNMKVTLENLPADFIGQIKIYDKRSKEEMATGIKSGVENFVLDLKTKKEFENTIFASALAGAGNHEKKEFRVDENYFTNNGDNLSIIGISSNRDLNSNFKDKIGNSLGANFTRKWNENMTTNGSVYYRNHKDGSSSSAYNEKYMKTGNSYTNSLNDGFFKYTSFSSDLGFRWKISKRIEFNLDGGYNISHNKSEQKSRTATFNRPPGLELKDPFAGYDNVPDSVKVNDNTMRGRSDSRDSGLNWNTSLTWKLNEKGTNLSFSFQGNDRKSEGNNISENSTVYYQVKNAFGSDSIYYTNQDMSMPKDNFDCSGGVALTHPFSERFRSQFTYRWRMLKNSDDRDTYDLSKEEKLYIDSLSNRNHERVNAHDIGLLLNYSDTLWNFDANIGVIPQQRELDQKVGLQRIDTISRNIDFSSSIDLRYNKKKYRISVRYDMRTSQPPLQQLSSFTDNSNPLFITRGNPDLHSRLDHSMRMDFWHTKWGLSANMMWSIVQNDVTTYSIYNEQTGGTTTTPVNIDGNWYANTNIRWMKSFGKWMTSMDVGGNLGNRVSLVNENHTDKPERSGMHSTRLQSRCRVAFHPKWGGFDLDASYNFGQSFNTLRDYTNYTRNYGLRMGTYADLFQCIQLRSDFSYSYRNGTNIQSRDAQEMLWNAGVKWRFLKKKRAEIEVYWSDILNRANDISRYSTDSGFNENYNYQQKGYIIATFKYKFQWMN